MRKLLVLIVLVGAVALGWYLRDHWTAPGAGETARVAAAADVWQSVSEARAATARQELERLSRRNGPASVTLQPGDLGALVLSEIARELPPSAESVEAAVIDSLYHVRATVRLSDLGGESALGPLAGLLGDRETMRFAGSFDVLRPGLAQYRVRHVEVGQFAVPQRLIPKLIARTRRGEPVEGLAPDALAIKVPEYIADVRIADGAVTLYRTAR